MPLTGTDRLVSTAHTVDVAPAIVRDTAPVALSPEQSAVLAAVMAGRSVFYTGGAGEHATTFF